MQENTATENYLTSILATTPGKAMIRLQTSHNIQYKKKSIKHTVYGIHGDVDRNVYIIENEKNEGKSMHVMIQKLHG